MRSINGTVSARQARRTANRWVIALAVPAMLLAACGGSGAATVTGSGGSAGASAAGTPKAGGDLVIAGYQEITTLDKEKAPTSNDALRVLENVYDRLYVLDAKATPVPSLAESSTLSDDKLTWTFKLRPTAKFSNDTPVTAKDVVFSLELARKGDIFGGLYEKIDTVSASGTDSVVIKTKTPEPVLLQLLTLITSGVIPADYAGKSADEFWKAPIGSGPWKLDTVTQGVGVKLTQNPAWWGEKGYLNSITFNTVADANTRLIQLRSGQAQLIETPSFAQLPSIETATTTVATFPSTEVDFIAFNTTKAPFDDAKFRQALSLAIDRQSIVQASLRGNGSPAATWMSKEVLGGYEPAEGIKFDLTAAKAALAASKTPTWDKPIVIELTKSVASGIPEAAQVIQANLQALGLTVQIQTVDTNAIQASTTDKTFDIHFGLLTYDIPDAGELVTYYFSSGGYNSFVDLAKTQELEATAAAEFDPAKRLELYKKVADQIVADAATPGLYTVPYFWGKSKSLNGFDVLLTGQFSFNSLWLA